MMKNNMEGFLYDLELWLKDKISEIDTFVTEQGDVEDWKHNKKQYEETITKKVLEYSSLVRKRLE